MEERCAFLHKKGNGVITLNDYFGPRLHHPDLTQRLWDNASEFLGKVNRLLDVARFECDYGWWLDPDTGTCVSGSKGGGGDGGWRPPTTTTGASDAKEKRGRAAEIYDPENVLDTWLTDEILKEHGLYREHPDDTPGWVHLQDIAPGSGNHTFKP